VGIRIQLRQPARHRVYRGLGLRKRHLRTESPDYREAEIPALGHLLAKVWAGRVDRNPHLRFGADGITRRGTGIRKLETLWHHANHLIAVAVEVDRLPDHPRIRSE